MTLISSMSNPDSKTELVRQLARDPPISKANAVETLQRCLQSVPVDQFKQTLDQIEHEIDRLNLSLQTLKGAVIDLRSRHDIRRDENLTKLETLWQGTDFLPSKFKPPTPSQDLIQELLLLSKEVARRGIGLHTLWEDNEEGTITLPHLIRQQRGRQKRPFLTVGVVRKARRELKDLSEPSQGQNGRNTAESTASRGEPEIELARHAPPPLADQSTSLELYEDLMTCTFSPNDAARKVTLPERSPFGSNEGSSPVRKRKRDIRNEHAGEGSPRLSLHDSPVPARSQLMERQRPSCLPTPLAASSSESRPLPLPASIALDDRMSPCTSLTPIDDSKAFKEIPLTLLRHGLRSTRHDTRLNDIVVNTLIQRLRRPGIWTVDSLTIDSHKRNNGSHINPRRRPKRDGATDFRDNMVLIPFFDKPREHWLLLSVDTSRARVDVYDSLPSQFIEETSIRDLLVDLCEDQSLASPENLKFYYQTVSFPLSLRLEMSLIKRIQSPQQSNDKDCGVFVVAAAMKLAEKMNLPSSWNVGQLRMDFAIHLRSSGHAAPRGFRDFEAPHVKSRTARFLGSLPPMAENPFQRWFEGFDAQKAKCAIHGSALVTLHGRHQGYLADLDGLESECHGIEKDVDALIGNVFTLSQRMMNPSRQLVHLQQELLRRVDVVAEGVRAQTALQDKRDAILSLVPSRLLEIKTMIVLCHIFGRRFVVARRRLDHMEALQNGFLAQATQLLEES